MQQLRHPVTATMTTAAITILLLFATPVHAVMLDFEIKPALSSMKQVTRWNVPSLGTQTFTSQQTFAGPSDTAFFGGVLYVDWNGSIASGTLEFLPISSVTAIRYAGGAQVFIPGEDNTGAPQYPPGPPFFGPTTPHGPANPVGGNFGTLASVVSAYAVTDGLRYDALVHPVMTLTAGFFDENQSGGQVWGAIAGQQDIVSAFGNSHSSLSTAGPGNTPFPLPLGTLGSAIGSWDGITLTIPINSIYSYVTAGGLPISITTTGVIVAAVRVPEPSSGMLLGFGLLGLLSCARRARRRLALAA